MVFERLKVVGLGFFRLRDFRGERQGDGVEEFVEGGALLFELEALGFKEHAVAVELEREKVDEGAVALGAEVQVGAGRSARRTDIADELPRLDGSSLGEAGREAGEVR